MREIKQQPSANMVSGWHSLVIQLVDARELVNHLCPPSPRQRTFYFQQDLKIRQSVTVYAYVVNHGVGHKVAQGALAAVAVVGLLVQLDVRGAQHHQALGLYLFLPGLHLLEHVLVCGKGEKQGLNERSG